MINPIPNGPFQNPRIADGIYDAEIEFLTKSTYGRDQEPYLKVVFSLPGADCYLATNFYFPVGRSLKSEQRLYRFCECVGLDKSDVLHHPHLFIERRLRLDIRCTRRPDVNNGNAYSDVAIFLPTIAQGTRATSDSMAETCEIA